MTDIVRFANIHKGDPVLLVGNGENLHLTPPEKFAYPSIGMNTIHLYDGWMPTYYTAVDRRVMNEFGAAIVEKFANIPKFIPSPKLIRWRGPNFFRFHNRPGRILSPKIRAEKIWQEKR